MNLYNLPFEVLFSILSNLSARELINICLTHQYGNDVCRDEYLWQRLIYNKYGVIQKIHLENIWYQEYIYLTQLFTPQQLIVLERIKTCPEKLDLLKSIYKYKYYTHAQTGTVVSLAEIVVYTVNYTVHSSILYSNIVLLVPNGETYGKKSFLNVSDIFNTLTQLETYIIDDDTYNILNNRQSYIGYLNGLIAYLCILNEEQLRALQFMYN